MKRISFSLLIASAIFIFSLSACKKENYAPIPSSATPQTAAPLTLHLVADNWTNYDKGMYVNRFSGVLNYANASGNRAVYVYLMTGDDHDIAINHTAITYMGNQLWATTTGTDLIINYRCAATKLPFTSLYLELVVK